jgi:hypothetical protein
VVLNLAAKNSKQELGLHFFPEAKGGLIVMDLTLIMG